MLQELDSGGAVDLGGDQTCPVDLRLAVAELRFQVQFQESVEGVVSQKDQQEEGFNGVGLVFINVIGLLAINQRIEAEVFNVPSLVTPSHDALGGSLLRRSSRHPDPIAGCNGSRFSAV